jgi:ribosomal protein S18 acetylase RimI-like enzyme
VSVPSRGLLHRRFPHWPSLRGQSSQLLPVLVPFHWPFDDHSHHNTRGNNSSGNVGCQYRKMIRQADVSDISSIKLRNEETLPENYPWQHYEDQLRCWPELSLVCETDVEVDEEVPVVLESVAKVDDDAQVRAGAPTERETRRNITAHTRSQQLVRSQQPNQPNQTGQRRGKRIEKKIVAYALGRTEVVGGPYQNEIYKGHVHSIAGWPEFGGLKIGVAREHVQPPRMIAFYNVELIFLHVRVSSSCIIAYAYSIISVIRTLPQVSNTAAVNLYIKHFGYKVVSVLPRYYLDGESCYLMQLTPR